MRPQPRPPTPRWLRQEPEDCEYAQANPLWRWTKRDHSIPCARPAATGAPDLATNRRLAAIYVKLTTEVSRSPGPSRGDPSPCRTSPRPPPSRRRLLGGAGRNWWPPWRSL